MALREFGLCRALEGAEGAGFRGGRRVGEERRRRLEEVAEVETRRFKARSVRVAGMEFAVEGGKGAEEEIADVGEDGGAARGDAAFGEQQEQTAEEEVDFGGGLELPEFAGEGGAEVGGIGRMG
jgi:hypothetical protein